MGMKRRQARQRSMATWSWRTTLSLRVRHEKSTLSPTFRSRITKSAARLPRCGCSLVGNLQLASGSRATSEPSSRAPTKVAKIYFVFRSRLAVRQAKRLCWLAQMTSEFVPFDRHVQQLLQDLAALCQAEHRSGPRRAARRESPIFKPFNPLSRNSINKEVRNKILAPLTPSDMHQHRLGYIYVVQSQHHVSSPPTFKIGFSKYHPKSNTHNLPRCLLGSEIIAHSPPIPHPKRIVSIIHTELVEHRKVQCCGLCGHSHRGWFSIHQGDALEVFTRWSRWGLQSPYTEGELCEEWRNHLMQQVIDIRNLEGSLGDQWTSIIDGFPFASPDARVESPKPSLAADREPITPSLNRKTPDQTTTNVVGNMPRPSTAQEAVARINQRNISQRGHEVLRYIRNLYASGAKLWTKDMFLRIEEDLAKAPQPASVMVRSMNGELARKWIPYPEGMSSLHDSTEYNIIFNTKDAYDRDNKSDDEDVDEARTTAACALSVGWETTESSPIDHLALKAAWDAAQRNWVHSATCNELMGIFRKRSELLKTIKKILCFGLGTLERSFDALATCDGLPLHSAMTQHAAALTLATVLGELQGTSPIPVLTQDPAYTPVAKQLLTELGIKIVGGLSSLGFTLIDYDTLVFSCHPDIPMKQIVADIAKPAAIIWNRVEPASEERTEWTLITIHGREILRSP
ncbi:hypothetical protein ACJZ2D_013400 [Fusarium nematophilum]